MSIRFIRLKFIGYLYKLLCHPAHVEIFDWIEEKFVIAMVHKISQEISKLVRFILWTPLTSVPNIHGNLCRKSSLPLDVSLSKKWKSKDIIWWLSIVVWDHKICLFFVKPASGTRGKVSGSLDRMIGFILWRPWMSTNFHANPFNSCWYPV